MAPAGGAPRESAWKLANSQITWCSGTISGLFATLAKQPVQRLKWLRQTNEVYRPYRAIASETLARHGYRGFFAGSAAAVYRNVPHSVLVYTFYPHAASLSRRALGDVRESFWSRFAAGYVTMVAATCFTHPLDTLRVRLAVVESPASYGAAARDLYRAEGARGFYGGFNATLAGAGPRGAVGFAVFETAKPWAARSEYFAERPGTAKVACGYVAGLLSESLVYPLDTVRRRQQALGSAHPIGRLSVVAALVRITTQEGASGLFKGVSLNLIKNPAATSISFTINDLVKDLLGYDADADAAPDPAARRLHRNITQSPGGLHSPEKPGGEETGGR